MSEVSPEKLVNPDSEEPERKFLVARMPQNLDIYRQRNITQGYLAIGKDSEVRLRDTDGKFEETVKVDVPGQLAVRKELTIPLAVEQFNTLWTATAGRRLEKVRYDIPLGDRIAELDIYKGRLAGLATVEVEFVDLDELNSFVAPDWFGREVTGEGPYKNQQLATQGWPYDFTG